MDVPCIGTERDGANLASVASGSDFLPVSFVVVAGGLSLSTLIRLRVLHVCYSLSSFGAEMEIS